MSRSVIDGLGAGSSQSESFFPQTPPRRRSLSARQKVFWSGFGIFLSLTLVALLWVQPLLAALPISSLPDKLSLSHFLQPGVYLVLFQNPDELRPTGGFMGSFAEVEVGWGLEIKHIRVETNIYTRDQAYQSAIHLEAPEPIREFLGTNPWLMRDSNWAIDFPEAAQTIAWFYQQEGGRPVNGVIATNSHLLEDILRITGPVSLPHYQLTLSADNVVSQLEQEVEKNYWQRDASQIENQPKAILADFLPMLFSQLRHQSPRALLSILADAFQTKELMVYSRDNRLAETLAKADWDGHINQQASDYLLINEANLTPVDGRTRVVGAKSSGSISQTVTLNRSLTPTGVTHSLSIDRHHVGQAIWPDGPNQSFLRIAVPAGSILLSAYRNRQLITGDIRLSQEADKTIFGLWTKLDPGSGERIDLTYQSSATALGSLVVQRQAGAPNFTLEIKDNGLERWVGKLERDIQI